ncbi:MAG: DNA adenine methylase [Panacibacter sp.]
MQVQVKEKMISSPIKWVGGKSRFRKQIISSIPQHSCYVELFAGGAWVLFGKEPSDVEVLNDIDQELINFFRVVKHKPEELISSFELELVARAEFNRLADLEPTSLNDIDRAHRFYYLIMAGWGGELNYPRFATSITDGGHGNRLIGALKFLRQRIDPVYERLKKVLIENLSWLECFERYDRKETFMYIDPPYPDNKCNYAHNMKSWDEHVILAQKLKVANCKWALSSYDNEKVRELYSGFNILPLQAYSGMRVKKNDMKRVMNLEVLITNYDIADRIPSSTLPFED